MRARPSSRQLLHALPYLGDPSPRPALLLYPAHAGRRGEGSKKLGLVALTAAALLLAACGSRSDPVSGDGRGGTTNPPGSTAKVKVGVGVVDMTPDIGYCAGQYCDYATDTLGGIINGDFDPFLTHKLKHASYGVQSRLTARAIVIEGANGKRVALLKTDNYLAQDMLLRRVGQLLAGGDSGIGYEQILYHVTHNHSSAYSSTLAAGLFVFQDVFDARFFENQARQMASAIETAAANLKPARMGATQIQHRVYKGNIVRLAVANDGTPAGYPLEYNDHGLVVLRFDDLSNPAQPKPLALWVNWGEHPESLDPHDLHSADFLGPLERYIERDIGAPLVYSQGDVGSAENSGDREELLDDRAQICGRWVGDQDTPESDTCPEGQGTIRDWNHRGYVQTERNVRFLADDIIKAWNQIGAGTAVVPLSSDFEVDWLNAWVPGPLSHPYPSVSNCNTAETVIGEAGVPVVGLPDCTRIQVPGADALLGGSAQLYALLKAENIPVPDHYDAPSIGVVEENLRLRLQTFRLGDILLASCACEAQSDLILNLESRLNRTRGDIYDGFDWACLLPEFKDDPAYTAACAVQKQYYDPADPENATAVPGENFDPAAIAHVRAQVHNDARGWDLPENALAANSENSDITQLWGNFTKEEIQDLNAPGYKLAVGIGHAGDYNGYTVSYREYMSRDSYRKALTSYGAHTADYMATRLVRMAASMQGGAALSGELLDPLAAIDEVRQQVVATTVGALSGAAFDAWDAGLPNDAGTPEPLQQPAAITRFQAAHFQWRGGSTAVDQPLVRIERESAPGLWLPHADQTGEVPLRVEFPDGLPGVLRTWTGMQEWLWTASYEAYTAFPARLGSTAPGNYRFCVEGESRQANATVPYAFCSEPYTIAPWDRIAISAPQLSGGEVRFDVADIVYPRSYEGSPFPFVADNEEARICDQCSFRPWARHGRFVKAELEVTRAGGGREVLAASCDAQGKACRVGVTLADGDLARIRAYDQDGNTGTRNAR
ncbi:MAG TPA: neutral/alkaline non-lysosomal ceramidase N-terminal domain-containing protein [Solimonas sp.]|nr:neutral/alkaline non-lysosomal ceramidase N-terminal domain-containing protein [Solimonas sp.]